MKQIDEMELFAKVIEKFAPESHLLKVSQLEGGVSAEVRLLEIENAIGEGEKILLRWQADSNSIETKFRLLPLLYQLDLPVQKVLYSDFTEEILPSPYILLEYIEGKTEFSPSNLEGLIAQMVEALAKIHQADISQLDFSFLPKQSDSVAERLKMPAQSETEENILRILENAWPLKTLNQTVLLHGDFWAGNLLWRDENLVAVIDWEDAALGDALADVGNARLEILWAYGFEAMNDFTAHYQKQNPANFQNLPYWDLYAALRPMNKIQHWGLEASVAQRMQENLHWFAEAAIEKLI